MEILALVDKDDRLFIFGCSENREGGNKFANFFYQCFDIDSILRGKGGVRGGIWSKIRF